MVDNYLVNQPLKLMQNSFIGKRCFIMGNGPSLKKMNLELLNEEVVWGFNKCYLLFDRISWRPNFYTTNDYRLTKDISSTINQLVKREINTTFFFPAQFNNPEMLNLSANIVWFNEKVLDNKFLSDWSFSSDTSLWVANAATVAITGLQLAAFLGFNPIYLIGCDTSYTVPDTVSTEGTPEKLVSTQSDDPNHFSSDYFSKGDKWLLPNVELMIQQYEKSKVILDKLGVCVYNATEGGNLEIFPRVNFESLFKN
jgi:hypothetical protein